jgi:hypothetical protein
VCKSEGKFLFSNQPHSKLLTFSYQIIELLFPVIFDQKFANLTKKKIIFICSFARCQTGLVGCAVAHNQKKSRFKSALLVYPLSPLFRLTLLIISEVLVSFCNQGPIL